MTSTVFRFLFFSLVFVACRTRNYGDSTTILNVSAQQLKLPSLFADHMVLQRDQTIRIWGYAKPGTNITVEFADQTRQIDNVGRLWEVEFPARPAGGPYSLTVQDASQTITINDILIGDVWLISGQSNSFFPVAQTDTANADLPTADNTRLRLFKQNIAGSDTELSDVDAGRWEVASPASVSAFSAVGYYFGQSIQESINIPIGLLQASKGETDIQEWTSQQALQAIDYDFSQRPEHPPGKLYNAMLAPLTAFNLAGVLWYQGENNSYIKSYYATLLKTFVNMFRKNWHNPDLPFLIVQLPNYNSPWGPDWPYIREAQLNVAQKLANTGLIVTIDLGMDQEIHPPNKKPVGLRAARLASALVYNKNIVPTGPLFKGQRLQNGAIEVQFEHVGDGLLASASPLAGFEIAGEDMNFIPASAKINQKNTVLVWHENIKKPRHVRYAWSNTPKISLINSEGLPASPFRTSSGTDESLEPNNN